VTHIHRQQQRQQQQQQQGHAAGRLISFLLPAQCAIIARGVLAVL
jgi:hypothetical protein